MLRSVTETILTAVIYHKRRRMSIIFPPFYFIYVNAKTQKMQNLQPFTVMWRYLIDFFGKGRYNDEK